MDSESRIQSSITFCWPARIYEMFVLFVRHIENEAVASILGGDSPSLAGLLYYPCCRRLVLVDKIYNNRDHGGIAPMFSSFAGSTCPCPQSAAAGGGPRQNSVFPCAGFSQRQIISLSRVSPLLILFSLSCLSRTLTPISLCLLCPSSDAKRWEREDIATACIAARRLPHPAQFCPLISSGNCNYAQRH